MSTPPSPPLKLNISDREYVIIGGTDTSEHIILELRARETGSKSFEVSSGSSCSLSPRMDPRESIVVDSTTIKNKKFFDWKLDEAYDEATSTIEIRGTRLNANERDMVLKALEISRDESDFASRIGSVKGIFLLDNDLLLSVLDRYGDGIYKIIEKLNYRYHLCYLSESIHKELYRRKESISRFQSIIDKPLLRIQLAGIAFAVFVTALCLLLVYLKK